LRFSKAIAIAAGVTMLMTLGTTSAMASRDNGHDDEDVTICHHTSDGWDEVEVSEDDADNYLDDNEGSFIVEDDNECPSDEVGDDDDDEEEADSNCSAEDRSGDSEVEQSGLVNLGNINLNLGNLLSNGLCQSNILNNLTAALLGGAFGGGEFESGSAEGCSAESHSGNSTADQEGLVNIGNVNLNAGNLASNLLCQSNIANNATVAVLGTAISGGGSDDDGDDDGGLLGILDTDDGILSLLGGIF
jgi:hypothetical protein